MVLVPAPLATGLTDMVATDDTSAAIDVFASAFVDYFGGASVLGIPANAGVIGGAPKTAMIAAMSGLNSIDGAAQAIQDGVTAFWNAVLPLALTVWPGTVGPIIPPAIAPPGLAGIASAVQAAFDANTAGGLSLSACASAVASAIHGTQAGGLVNLGPPPPPGTPNVPIL
jgi:hypothetical protein